MMLDAKETELDNSHDEVQTSAQIAAVTAGDGVYSLTNYVLRFGGETEFKQAYDISINGVVSVD
jgi:hypothetical protein